MNQRGYGPFVRYLGGGNEKVESIMIHSFVYRISDAPPTVLLSGYVYNFWMQNNPRYESRDLPPIAYEPDGNVSIEVHFTLNGETYRFEGDMAGRENTTTMPTVLVDQCIGSARAPQSSSRVD